MYTDQIRRNGVTSGKDNLELRWLENSDGVAVKWWIAESDETSPADVHTYPLTLRKPETSSDCATLAERVLFLLMERSFPAEMVNDICRHCLAEIQVEHGRGNPVARFGEIPSLLLLASKLAATTRFHDDDQHAAPLISACWQYMRAWSGSYKGDASD